MSKNHEKIKLTNRSEYDNFFKNALAITGSITPLIIPRILFFTLYSALIVWSDTYYRPLKLELAPFEFAGIVLGIILVIRLNAGYERWWEARKWWGSIVNQCRNLAICGLSYAKSDNEWLKSFIGHVACLPYVFKNSLRAQDGTHEYEAYVGKEVAEKINSKKHMPSYISQRISNLLNEAREKDCLDGFSFLAAEKQRAYLIDAIGACERILKTPIPLVIAINTRRFILVFLLFLPFPLLVQLGWLTPFAILVISYALLSLDQIGIELQNPFGQDKRSHLPLQSICETIASNAMEMLEDSPK